MENLTVLDNPIWHALTTTQSELAEIHQQARRYPHDIGPFCGMAEQTQEAYDALMTLAAPEEQVVLFLDQPAITPQGWQLEVSGQLTQMIFTGKKPSLTDKVVETLTPEDIPEMLALTHLTKPGPFRTRTIELGTYVGIREGGQLVAMAGERLKTERYTEISAVCTHPDAQGKGYAKAVMTTVIHNILQADRVPFLHSRPDNSSALHVYEKLGFETRRLIHLAVFQKTMLTH